MSILDKVKIGNSVQVNLELSKDRLNKETIDAINVSSLGKVSDFRILMAKVLELSCNYLMDKSNGFLRMKLIFSTKMVM